MFRFRMDVAGEIQLDRAIARFAEGISDYSPIWPVIADDFYAEEKLQFQTEGAEGGQKWQELSPEYAGWKAAHFPGQPILQRTGSLMSSLTSASDPNAINIQARKTLTLGTRVPYAIYHQSTLPRTRLPRRPEIMLTEQFKVATMRNIQAYMVQIATREGFRTGLGPLDTSKLSAGAGGGPGIPPRKGVHSVSRDTQGRFQKVHR